jgi:hypothetical protein
VTIYNKVFLTSIEKEHILSYSHVLKYVIVVKRLSPDHDDMFS